MGVCACSAQHSIHVQCPRDLEGLPVAGLRAVSAQEGQKLKNARNHSIIGAGRVRPRFKTRPLPLPKLKLIYSFKTMGLSSPLSVLWFCAVRNYDGIKMLIIFIYMGL